MDRDRFLRELDEIRTGRRAPDSSSGATAAVVVEGDEGLCNRIYLKLVECLAYESKNVEAKLQVLTSALSYYVDLRPHYDVMSPEADAFGHYLFMECSRLVLGIEFHHLKSDDTFKCAFKGAIGDVYRKLQDYAIGQVFLVLEWLMVNQWSHPTLVAMMKGEDIDKERALTYIRSGEYPELFRLRVEMLMESGCDNFASNLVSWCVQSPLFEGDVPLRSTHLLLLHKLGRNEQLHNQCCQLSCCIAKDILRHLMTRSEEPSFLLLMAQTFLLLNWIKPGDFCCTKELLEFWLTTEHQGEPEGDKFLDSINKVISLTQDIRQITIFLEVMVELFESKFVQFCTLLALNSLRKERHRLEIARDCQKDEREAEDATGSLVRICRLVARLYIHHHQMYLACLLTVLYLEPNGPNFLAVESFIQDLAEIPPTEPHCPIAVDPHHYAAVLEIVELLRPAKFHLKFGWKELKLFVLGHLESAGYKFDPDKNAMVQVVDRNQLGRTALRLRINPEKLSTYVSGGDVDSSRGVDEKAVDSFCSISVAQDLVMARDENASNAGQMSSPVQFNFSQIHDSSGVLGDLKLLDVIKDAGDRWSSSGDGAASPMYPASLSSQKFVAVGDDSVVTIYQQQLQAAADMYPLDSVASFSQLSGHQMVTNKVHPGFTLDDIQQVLSATQTSCDGSSAGGTDIPMDERKLREITAFLLGRHPDGPTTFTAGICPAPLSACVNDGTAMHTSIGYNDSVIRSADSAMHPVVVTFDATNCASAAGVFSSVSSVLPHDNRPDDMQFNASTSLSSSYPPAHSLASSVSSSPASQKDAFGLGKVAGPSAVVIPSNAFPAAANCLGSTILVTESNLPYLQQFLPNLQTVMQSVQSLVRGVPSQGNGSKPDGHPIGSKDDSTDSADMLQEVPNVTVSSFASIPASDRHACLEHGSPPKMARTVSATELAPVDGCTATCGIQLDKADRLPDVEHEAADDAGENVLRSKEKCRLISKEGTDPDKFCCRFCRRGFSTMAQRRRHTEWLCPKKKAAHPTAQQVSSCLKCDPSGKTFVAKLSHATDMLHAEFEQRTPEAAIDLDAASPGVRLPDDFTLRDCFVKIVRMDKNSEGSSDEGVPLEELNPLKKEIDEKESGVGPNEEACMCERCGELLSSYSKLNVHKDHCNVTLPLELSLSSEKLSAENIPLKQQQQQHASCSILALNSAGQPVSCNVNTSNSSMIYNGLLPHVALAEHNAYFVKNPGQVGALTMPESIGIKQGAVLEMLQLADHFLKHNKFVANGSPAAPKAREHAPETQPKLEPSSGGLNAIFRSRFVAPVVATPTKSNPPSADVSCMPPIGVFSSPTGKRVVTIKTVGFNPHDSSAGSRVCWPKSEQEKSDSGSTFQLNVKPDVVVDGHLSVGKEILYEGTKMREYVEFQCETCLLTFNEGTLANSHVEGSDHGNSSVASYHVYVCTSCNIKYRDKQVMRNHILYICTGNSLGTMITANQRQLHKCNLCSKAFISGEFLQVHLSVKHGMKNRVVLPSQAWLSNKVAFPGDALAAAAKELHSTTATETPCTSSDGAVGGTSAFQKTMWPGSAASAATLATGTPQPYRFTTPSAVSIPTLEQLTSGYGKTSSDEKDKAKCPDLASSHQAPSMLSPLGSSIPDILASIPEHGDAQKQAAATSTDVRQLVGVAQGACLKQRSSKAKGILYKNVFMQCEGTYYCSVCKADLSTRESKKNHRQMPCGDPRTITYSRKYSYLCPYCMERFPSQKTCRQHQVSECLPLIGISTEELSVKELICPLCPKKYFNLIPLKGHMTQVHKLPKVETREMLLRLGYMDPNVADDQGKASSDGGFVLPEGMVQQRSLSSGDYTSGDHTSSTEVEFVQRSMLFDFENDVDVSSECAVQGQDILIQNSCEQCPEMEVIYDGEIFINQEDKKLKDNDVDLTVTEEMEINSVILGGEEARLVNFSGSEKNPSIGMDQYLGHWSDDGGNLSEMAISKPQSFLQEAPADSTVSPEQRRRKPRQANEFFVMMFRNYPILAKGVSICAGCQTQMSSNSEVENHLSSATCRGADGRPADIKRSTIFKCTHCDKTFWKAKTCRQHQLDTCLPLNGVEVDNLVQPSVACPLCSAKSYNRSGLMSHMKYKHGMDTKGVRDIMEQYGIHKKTAELVVPPLSASSGSTVGSSSSTTASVGADGVNDLPSNGNFQKTVNHFDLDGAKRLYALENAGGVHLLNSKNPQSSSPLAGESCSAQFGAKSSSAAAAAGDQFEVQRLYASIGSLSQDQDHVAMVGTSFNSIT